MSIAALTTGDVPDICYVDNGDFLLLPQAAWNDTVADVSEVVDSQPTTLPEDRSTGAAMHYTSGTTGKPKGVKRALADIDPDVSAELFTFLLGLFGITANEGNVRKPPDRVQFADRINQNDTIAILYRLLYFATTNEGFVLLRQQSTDSVEAILLAGNED